MSGIFRSIFNYFFRQGDLTNPQTVSPVETRDAYGAGDWSESLPSKRLKFGGDALSDSTGVPYQGTGSIKARNSKFISSACGEYSPALVNYQWKYGTGEFTDSIAKAVGLEKSDNKCDELEDECRARAKGTDTSKEDDLKDSDQFSTDSKQVFDPDTSDHRESSPILPEISSDESDGDDTILLDDVAVGEKKREDETNEEPEDTSGTLSCQSDDREVRATLPSMPDLDFPEERVMTQLMTVIPVHKTPKIIRRVNESGCLRESGIAETASFIVVSGTRYLPPVNLNHAIEAGKSNVMPIGKAFGANDAASISYPCLNMETNPVKSPVRNTKKLLDIHRHSRLDFVPERIPSSDPSGTPPNSPMSADNMAFHSAKSRITSGENSSASPASSADHTSRTPKYTVRLVNRCNSGALASSPNRKFVLVKCKDDSDAPKIPVGGSIMLTPGKPGTTVQKKNVFATPMASSSKTAPRTISFWPRTPHPQPKTPREIIARVAGSVRDNSAQKNVPSRAMPSSKSSDQTPSTKSSNQTPSSEAPKSVPKVLVNVTSGDGKRSRSDLKVQGHCPSKKAKLDVPYSETPRRLLRSKIPSSKVDIPRAMRKRNPSIVYKS